MQAATVCAESSGDSGWTWSRMAAATVVSSAASASTTSRSAAVASSRVSPTGVNRAMLCLYRSKTRFGYAAWEYSLMSPPRIVCRCTGVAARSSSVGGGLIGVGR